MNNLAIVQFDSRFDKYCMCEVNGKKLIEYTVERVFKINGVQKVIISTKNIVGNQTFLEKTFANFENVEVFYSETDSLGKRFVASLKNRVYDFVFRVRADQGVLDFDIVNNIIKEIQKKENGFYYNPNNLGNICDFISYEEVKKRESKIELLERYFQVYTDNEVNECITVYDEKEKNFNRYINDKFKFELFENGINNEGEEKEFEKFEKSIQQNLLSEVGYLYKIGYLSSFYRKNLVDLESNIIPWMNYGIIKFLEERLKKEFIVAEYGSGSSTIWLQERVRKLYSIEHDKIWFNEIQGKLKKNVIYLECPLNEGYEMVINGLKEKFEVIFIDGRNRVKCIKMSISNLKENGIIILDDSDRDYYFEGEQFLVDRGFKKLIFEGVKPMSFENHRTTIFYRANNCFGI